MYDFAGDKSNNDTARESRELGTAHAELGMQEATRRPIPSIAAQPNNLNELSTIIRCLEDGIDLEGVQQVRGLLPDQHGLVVAIAGGQAPQLVRDGVLGYKLLGPRVVLVDHLDHLQQIERRQRGRCAQQLHHQPCQASNCHLHLHRSIYSVRTLGSQSSLGASSAGIWF